LHADKIKRKWGKNGKYKYAMRWVGFRDGKVGKWKSTRENNKKPKAANIKSKIDHKPDAGPEMKISGKREKENTKLIYAPFCFWLLFQDPFFGQDEA